jgi:hypothetical protein
VPVRACHSEVHQPLGFGDPPGFSEGNGGLSNGLKMSS